MLKHIKLILLILSLSVLTACGSGSTKTNYSAIDKIILYAKNSGNPKPTLKDYREAGVTGLENINLKELNDKVASLSPEDVDTVEELDAITASLGINIIPVARAGVDQSASFGTNINLSATASSDADGTITAWLWKESGATLSTSQSFSKNDFSVGIHNITLTVTDDDGATASDTVVVTITAPLPENHAPIANAGADQTGTLGDNITLDASASSDSDGTITAWLWKESGATLSTSQSFSKNDFSVGTHNITLTVTDDDGATASDTVVVTITNGETHTLFSIAPIADAETPEYIYFNNAEYVPADQDESGHYTSVTPSLIGASPVGRVVYTLSGADAEEFVINKKTGQVALDYKDFEHPTDANTDNSYEVTITATDEAGNSDSESWRVTITDIAGETVDKHIISLNGSSLMRVKAGSVFVDPGATVIPFDAGNNVSLKTVIYSNYTLDPELSNIDTNNPNDKTFHIIYRAEDTAHPELSAPEVSRTVIVEDVDDFASLGAITTIDVTATDSSQKTFSSTEEDYIQKALYYANEHGGGVVHFNSGIHYFKRQLVVYSDTTLEGTTVAGNITSTLKLMDYSIRKAWKNSALSFGNSHPLITNASGYDDNYQFIADKTESSSSNITIKDVIIDGNRERQRSWISAGSNNSIGVWFENTNGIHIDNIKLYNTLSDGIATINCSNMDVRNSTFRFMGHSALFIAETQNVVTDNLTIDVLSNSGIRFFGGSNFTISNNHIFCTTNGGNFAIQISNNYSSGNPVDNVLIENNIIRHTAIAGIALYTNTTSDIIQGVTIRNNIIYRAASVASNKAIFIAKEANERIHEGGSINIQHVKQIDINHNTIFNGQGSGIRLDNRFYIPDGTTQDWLNLEELDRMPKTASITNNVIVGNKVSSSYPEYSDAVAYGIEKRVAMYCGTNHNEECAGTTVTTANNLFALNEDGKVSSNITLNASDNGVFPGFVDAPLFNGDIREVSYYYDTETNLNLNLQGVGNPQVGASAALLQKSMDLYNEYKSFFTPLPE